jgi:hypothetical protein
MTYRVILALALASPPTTTSAQDAARDGPAYCSELKEIVSLAMTKARFSDIAGKPQQGDFHDTNLPLSGWRNCSLYGTGTYTCDSVEMDTADQAEARQAAILREIKACLGQGWSQADGRSSPSHVVLHSALRPVSITLSMDATDNKTCVYPQKVAAGHDRIGHQHPR